MIATIILSIGFIIHAYMCFIINKNHLEYHEKKDTKQIAKNIELMNAIFELECKIKKLEGEQDGEQKRNSQEG